MPCNSGRRKTLTVANYFDTQSTEYRRLDLHWPDPSLASPAAATATAGPVAAPAARPVRTAGQPYLGPGHTGDPDMAAAWPSWTCRDGEASPASHAQR